MEFHRSRPAPQTTSWEAVAEFSVVFGSEPHALLGWRWSDVALARMNVGGAGEHRVRVHVRDRWRFAAEGDAEDRPEEFWLVQVWVEPHRPEVFLLDDPRRGVPGWG